MVLLKENENSKPLPPRLWAKFLKDLDLYIQRAGKPTRLIVLEEIANRAVTNVLTESNNPQRVRQAAMNELRQLFNLVRSLFVKVFYTYRETGRSHMVSVLLASFIGYVFFSLMAFGVVWVIPHMIQ